VNTILEGEGHVLSFCKNPLFQPHLIGKNFFFFCHPMHPNFFWKNKTIIKKNK